MVEPSWMKVLLHEASCQDKPFLFLILITSLLKLNQRDVPKQYCTGMPSFLSLEK